MHKFALVNCYSDENRGDAGIIISTIQLLKKIKPNSKISLHSTFSERDKRYHNCHFATPEFSDSVFPAVFPEPYIETENSKQNNLRKLFLFIWFVTKASILYLFPKSTFIENAFFTTEQKKAIQELKSADVVISKGGSFLYSLGGISGIFFLIRMLYPLVIGKRFGKKTVIFSQSIGPYNNALSKKIASWVFNKIDLIYLRESECIKYMNNYENFKDKVHIIPDSAFYLNCDNYDCNIKVDKELINIGITVRSYESDGKRDAGLYDNYINEIAKVVKTLNSQYEGKVHFYLYAQVTGPSEHEDDRIARYKLHSQIKALESDLINRCTLVDIMRFPQEYKVCYSKMDFMICTRLHSAIFSIGAKTPVVNISYHGTKSIGIMSASGMRNAVINISNISSRKLFDYIVCSLSDQKAGAFLSKVNLEKIELLEKSIKMVCSSNA